MADTSHRARKVLAAVVNEYLRTGEAVGSRTVTRRYGIDLSPATVRNVMSDLEEAGLLKQPHTSAGRLPTNLGLRYFVDSLLKVRTLAPKEREELSSRYQLAGDDLDSALRDATRILAELSSHTVVLTTPRSDVDVLEHLEFVRLRDRQLLAVIVTRAGQIHNKIVQTDDNLALEVLERMNNYLNHTLAGQTIESVLLQIRTELASERVRYLNLERRALELSAEVVPGATSSTSDHMVIIEGQAQVLQRLENQAQPEEIKKVKDLFRALEEKQNLLKLLEETAGAPGIRVFIGAETQIEELKDFTLVAANYGAAEASLGGAHALGTLGVIGPVRMNYQRIINLVDFTAQLVSDIIKR